MTVERLDFEQFVLRFRGGRDDRHPRYEMCFELDGSDLAHLGWNVPLIRRIWDVWDRWQQSGDTPMLTGAEEEGLRRALLNLDCYGSLVGALVELSTTGTTNGCLTEFQSGVEQLVRMEFPLSQARVTPSALGELLVALGAVARDYDYSSDFLEWILPDVLEALLSS